MGGSKVEAMKRIADETDHGGGTRFPPFMRENMRYWEQEGLVTVNYRDGIARITDKGRKLAKKSMATP